MNNKLNNIINDFLANTDAKDENELNEKLQDFMQMYFSGEMQYENTPLDDAYELLDKASNANSKEQAIKYAKQALKICPECFDAVLFQVQLENNPLKRRNLLDKGLKSEKTRLEKEGYFEKDNIGVFYGIFETRPYIRGLYTKAVNLAFAGKMKQAIEVCKEILKLNENDNLGARYLLIAIYAYLEDEKEVLKLYKKYSEESFEMLFPLFVLYYKQDNDKKAKEYLNKANKANPNLVKFFKGTMKPDKNILEGYYSRGGSSEIEMYFEQYGFLIDTVPYMECYILENSKSK